MWRFDVVVVNYKRLDAFFANWDRIQHFDPGCDRLTIVSCSPSAEEQARIAAFEDARKVPVRYLVRRNYGADSGARLDYFTGSTGTLEQNLDAEWTMQMQEHYLAPADSSARWGPEFGGRVKGDIVPDHVRFDLDHLYRRAADENLDGMFADRLGPHRIVLGDRTYLSPNGANFIIATRHLRSPTAQEYFRQLLIRGDGSKRWGVYVEYALGRVCFPEGRRVLDIATGRVWDRWPADQFGQANPEYRRLTRLYESPAPVRLAIRAAEAPSNLVASMRRRAAPRPV